MTVKPAQTQLCIDYADKIPVDEFHRMAGGNCINAAVAAARLGLKVAVYVSMPSSWSSLRIERPSGSAPVTPLQR